MNTKLNRLYLLCCSVYQSINMSLSSKVIASSTTDLSNRNTLHIYRDILRLIKHISGDSKKSTLTRDMIRKQFKTNKYINDDKQIQLLRNQAIQGLTNYLTITSFKQNNIQLPQQKINKNNNKKT